MRRQDRLAAQMNSGPPPHLRRSVEDDILAGAWVDPGAYSGDLDQFVAAASSVSPSALSNPDSLAYDLAAVVRDAGTLKNDVLTPPISVADWLAFKDDLAALALDCGTSIH
jgi:hypothetical protein